MLAASSSEASVHDRSRLLLLLLACVAPWLGGCAVGASTHAPWTAAGPRGAASWGAPPARAPLVAAGRQDGAAPVGEDEVHIPLWPLVEWRTDADGRTHVSALLLFARTTAPDGSTESFRVVNWLSAEDLSVVFPLWYDVGPEGDADKGLVPLAFWGPGYGIFPLALSWFWKDETGSSTWITPLYHHTYDASGRLVSQHVLTFVRTDSGWVAFPLAYSLGEEGARHSGLFPIWFQGPDYKVLFPIGYSLGPEHDRHRGLVLLYHDGPGYWFSPLAFSGSWTNAVGGSTTWVTPLAHWSTDGEEVTDWHAALWFQGPGYTVLLPVGYVFDSFDGPPHRGLLLVWHDGPGYGVSPLLFSGWFDIGDDLTCTWLTPLAHWTAGPDGVVDWHALLWFQGEEYKVLFPLWYSYGPEGDKRRGLIPLWFSGQDFWFVPVALSGGWRNVDDGWTTWITPLFHRTDVPDGPDSWHLLNWFQGAGHQVFFPLWYRYGAPDADAWNWGLFPFVHVSAERDFVFAPLLLSAYGENPDGGSTTWVTPLFHWTRRPEAPDSFHALNYFQGEDYKIFFPLAWSVGPPEERYRGILPLYLDGPRWGVAPLLLSAWWTGEDDATTAWVTPLYHHTKEADGTLRSRHALNWYQQEDLATLFPLWWDWRTSEGHERTMLLPLWWRTRYADGDVAQSVLPPFVAWRDAAELNTGLGFQSIPFSWQDAGDDWEFAFLWRLFHVRHQDEVRTTTVGPLWWSESKPGLPLDWKVLGGLVARDVLESRGTARWRVLWFLPFGEEPLSTG